MESGLFMLMLEMDEAVEGLELRNYVQRYFQLLEPRPLATDFQSIVVSIWPAALAYSVRLSQDYRRYKSKIAHSLEAGDDYLLQLLSTWSNCWSILALDGDADASSTTAAEIAEEIEAARAQQNVSEAAWVDGDRWRAMAVLALYQHLAAVRALSEGDNVRAQKHLYYANELADRVDTAFSVASGLLAAAVHVRTGVAVIREMPVGESKDFRV
jgi:hypothetical protein